ncbi:signal transduction histidine kinase, LytS [Corchorus olitorius]|uniref:Signal transduction histidine kinase, LytS n=1 Tax=Corchorus olitorius TaxID=93759 RepID=A0A1R3KYI3_9ROSI|nr:signal transduction histidine kinase, LytS [Corchorus olitorius]
MAMTNADSNDEMKKKSAKEFAEWIRSEYLWVPYPAHYFIAFFTFLSTAVVFGIRTYNLNQSRRQMPAAASASV